MVGHLSEQAPEFQERGWLGVHSPIVGATWTHEMDRAPELHGSSAGMETFGFGMVSVGAADLRA
jgi:hypothetical protein